MRWPLSSPGPATAPGREESDDDVRGLRKRSRRQVAGPEEEAGGCGPQVGRREETRQRRKMVARASGRDVEGDTSGEVSPGRGSREWRGRGTRWDLLSRGTGPAKQQLGRLAFLLQFARK